MFLFQSLHSNAVNTMRNDQVVIFDLGGVLLREAEVNLHKANCKD